MRAAKTTIRFKLSRAEDARALEYLRDRKAAGSSFSKSVVQVRHGQRLRVHGRGAECDGRCEMRAAKTTIRFKLSRAEDTRALEYLRNRKAAGSSFSKSVVQAINDCLDAQEAESREDSFMGRFRLMLREELKGLGNTVPFQSVSEPLQPSQENAEQTLAFLNAFDGME